MRECYAIEAIGTRTIEKAFPLARIVAQALSPLQWRRFCRSCQSAGRRGERQGREQVVVVLDAKAYVRGLCVFAIRRHAAYGCVLDVPILIAASAADGEGVASALVNFLRVACDDAGCSGIRFWIMTAETWARRREPAYIARSDHGLFMPALASAADIKVALCAPTISVVEAIDRFSR